MKKKELLKWIIANAFGLGIGFLLALVALMVMQYGFDYQKHWQWVPPKQELSHYFGYLISGLVGGLIVGLAQSFIIKHHGIKAVSWVLATVAGFGLIILIDWPLLYTGQLGRIPGPAEPIIFTIGGSIFAGIMQFILLRRKGINGTKWLLIMTTGLVLAMVPTALFFMFIGDPIGISWPLEVFFSGFFVAGFAALFSGKSFFMMLSNQE